VFVRAIIVTYVIYMYLLRVGYGYLCYVCYLQVYAACLLRLSLLLTLFTCICCVFVRDIIVTYVIFMFMLRVC